MENYKGNYLKSLIIFLLFGLLLFSKALEAQIIVNQSDENLSNGIGNQLKNISITGSLNVVDHHFTINTQNIFSEHANLQGMGMHYKFYDAPLCGFIGYNGVHYLPGKLDDSTRMSVLIYDTSTTFLSQGIETPDRYWGLRVKRYSESSPFINLTIMHSQSRGIDYGFQARAGKTYLYIDKTKHMARFAMDTSDYSPYYQVSQDSGITWSTIFSCNNEGEGFFSKKLGIGTSSTHEAFEVIGSAVVSNDLKLNSEISQIPGSNSGILYWTIPFNGKSYKKIVLYFENFSSEEVQIIFPIEFTFTPFAYGAIPLSNISISKEVIAVKSVSNLNGFLILEGY